MRNETQDETAISLEDDTAFSERMHRQERRSRKNIGILEGRLSAGMGGALLLLGLLSRRRWGLGLMSTGGYLLYRGLSRRDPIYRLFGLNTETQGDQGRVEVERTIVIERPVSEVYGYWRNLEQLPRFMRHLTAVREIDSQRSHWVASAPAGMTVEWDAEIVQDLPNKRLSWHSLPDSEVMNSGVVHFRDLGNDATEVQIFLVYAPPAGAVGVGVARLLGAEPGRQVEEDLQRLKDLLESTDQAAEPTMSDRLAASAADDAVEEIDSATYP
jgi:uncharacterized membrane protein